MTQVKHTPGQICRNPTLPQRPLEVAGLHLAHFSKGSGGVEPEANARRICAAWNACEGITTEALEDGAVRDMMEALQMMLALHPIDGRAQRKARAVIARATGEKP